MQQTNEPKKQTKKWYKKLWIMIPLGIFVAPVVIITLIATIYGIFTATQETSQSPNGNQAASQASENKNQQSTVKYIQPEWEITNTETVGSTYIVATGYLMNRTSEAGIADCNIEFYDREIKWAGGKGFGGRELQPDERYDFTVQVEVTNTGLISKQNIDCEDGIY